MSLYRDNAVVLRTYKLGESDRIVVFMTEEHGKVRAVAKGVRKTRSRLGSRLEPLSQVSVLLYRGRELDVVSQVDTVVGAGGLRVSLDKMTQGMAMLEAVDQMTIDREPVPHIYAMLTGALGSLARDASPLIVAAFFLKLLGSEGLAPQLDECVVCGEAAEIVAFDPVAGGVQCRNCRTGASVSPGALDLMRRILGGRLASALAEPETSGTHEVTQIATRAIEIHCERRLKSVGMFERHD
ncbi:MAG: repair protein RecO [Actinomycetota bacterium]|jgi:DNA repair protein RecO (recombination protein O)